VKRWLRGFAGVVGCICGLGVVFAGVADVPVARAETAGLTLSQAKAQLSDLQSKVDGLQTELEASNDVLNQALVDQADLEDQVAAQQVVIDQMAPAFAEIVNASRQGVGWQTTVQFLLNDDAADFILHMGVTANVQVAMNEQMTLLGDEKQRLVDMNDSLDTAIDAARAEVEVQQALIDQQKAAEAAAQALVNKLSAAQRAQLPGGGAISPGTQPQTVHLVQLIQSLFPQIVNVGTVRAGTGDHGKGLAADFMIPNYKANVDLGWQIANYVKDHASELKVKYIIWQQSIWQTSRPGAGWKHMADRGSDNQNHINHVHVSLYA